MTVLHRLGASLRRLDDSPVGLRMRRSLQSTWGLPLVPPEV